MLNAAVGVNHGETVYDVRGERIASLEDFYREIGEAINGPGGYFGRNLDAFNDCLAGRLRHAR
jgi:RNAse (barnase) inhibitor barstar